jgi:hypothetical protein
MKFFLNDEVHCSFFFFLQIYDFFANIVSWDDYKSPLTIF